MTRSYGDPCGIARALDVVGERWALLIVRELLFGPKRFTDLKAGLAGASPNVLSQRLRELEAGGIVQRRRAGGALYELTDWGRELHPILLSLGRWGARSPVGPVGVLSVDALMVALEATFVPENAAALRANYEIRLGEDRFSVDIDDGAIAIGRANSRNPDAIIDTDPSTLRALVFGDRKLAGAPVEIRGDARLARKFFRLFARPSSPPPQRM
ncbi:helix-turn-helix transcriptional regulator [Pendulispora brunnea]|uniref:Helix-turn-helix transcriptional regulator n=1 Tax=Pendulispora brunnea TaxID=2905690 RepID=A0ABZ2K0N4_9BACT